jgi:endonuclease G, mitochondrial
MPTCYGNLVGKNSQIKMKQLLLVLLLLPTLAWAGIAEQCPQFVPYAAPQAKLQAQDQELCKQNYAVIHQCSTKTPLLIMEHVTQAAISGPAKRRDDFRADPSVHESCRAQLGDYAGHPYDRGHMAPAANNTQSVEIMSESFFLSNMVPQVPNHNRGIWRQLEIWVRDWAKDPARDIYVISGAIYQPGHKTIGNGVGVPTHMYKIVVDKNKGTANAWLLPNAPIPVADLPKYKTTVPAVEQASGIQFNLK